MQVSLKAKNFLRKKGGEKRIIKIQITKKSLNNDHIKLSTKYRAGVLAKFLPLCVFVLISHELDI
jgi:hypothetical protein